MLFQLSTLVAVSAFLSQTSTNNPINGWWVVAIFLVLVVVVSLLILSNRQTPSIAPLAPDTHGHATGTHTGDTGES